MQKKSKYSSLILIFLSVVFVALLGGRCDAENSSDKLDFAMSILPYNGTIVFTRNYDQTCFLKKKGEKYQIINSIKGNKIGHNYKNDIVVIDSVLYELSARTLRIYQIKDVENIGLIGSFNGFLAESDLNSITVDKNIAYITDYFHGLYMLDVSDPCNIKLLDQYSQVNYAESGALTYQNLILIADNNGLKVLEKTPRNKLKLKKEIPQPTVHEAPTPGEIECACCTAPALSFDLLRDNNIVYAANNKMLVVYKISPSLDVTKYGELVFPEPWSNEGDCVSIALVGPGKLLHSNGGVPQLYFVDVSDPSKPVIVHTEKDKQLSTGNMLVVDDKLYITGYKEDLFNIYKVDWPNKLTLLYRFNEPAVQDNKTTMGTTLVPTQ